jgi:hypothetical protein
MFLCCFQVAPFDVEHGNASNVVVAESSGSNRDAEVLEEGESTTGPSQPNGVNSRLKGADLSDSSDDFFATGKDQEFQCTVRFLVCSNPLVQHTRVAYRLCRIKISILVMRLD